MMILRPAYLGVMLCCSCISPTLVIASAIPPNPSVSLPAGYAGGENQSMAVLIGMGFLLLTVLISIIGSLAKRQLDQILTTQTSILDQQSQCRATLAERFALKAEVRDDLNGIRRSIAGVHNRIDRLEGRNGRDEA